ncbi:MAG: hypothetical protein ACYTAF_17330, partial [Planctomycetota bacterium]
LGAGTWRIKKDIRERVVVPRGVRIVGAGADRTTVQGRLRIGDESAPCEIADLTIDPGETQSKEETLGIHGEKIDEAFVHDVRVHQSRVAGDYTAFMKAAVSVGGGAGNRPDLVNCEVFPGSRVEVVLVGGAARPRFERLALQDDSGSRPRRELLRVCDTGGPVFAGCSFPPAVRIAGGNPAFSGCFFPFPDGDGAAVDLVAGKGSFSACRFRLPDRGEGAAAIRVVSPGELEVSGCRFVSRAPPAAAPSIAVLRDKVGGRLPVTLARGNHFVNCCVGVGASAKGTDPVGPVPWEFGVEKYDER